MSAVEFVVAALALWRLSAMVSYERGPGDLFTRLRARVGFEHDDNNAPVNWPDHWPANMMACVWCLSVNLALPCALLWLVLPDVAFWLSVPLALSAGAVLVERIARARGDG